MKNVILNYELSVKGVKYEVEIFSYVKGTKKKIKMGLEEGWLFKYFNDENEIECKQGCYVGKNKKYFEWPIFKVKRVA